MSVQTAGTVECIAFMFPLDNLTRAFMAVLSNHFSMPQLYFGTLHSFIACVYWHHWGRGLTLAISCQSLEVQLEVGAHPVTVGFSTA